MIAVTTYLIPEEAARAQEAADACDMSLGEFARWAVVLQSVAIVNSDQETIDQPWGAPVEDHPHDTHAAFEAEDVEPEVKP